MGDKNLRVFKLREQTEDDLSKGLEKLKEELNTLRVSRVAGGTASKLGRIKIVRKAIAKYLTVANEKARDSIRKQYEKQSLLPKDLRAKKTRSIRRRLTTSEKRQKTDRQWKRLNNFPLRKYALKA